MRVHGTRRGVQFRGCIALYFLAKYGGHSTRALLRDAKAAAAQVHVQQQKKGAEKEESNANTCICFYCQTSILIQIMINVLFIALFCSALFRCARPAMPILRTRTVSCTGPIMPCRNSHNMASSRVFVFLNYSEVQRQRSGEPEEIT